MTKEDMQKEDKVRN